MIYGAILAGGSGKRFGSSLPKQFLPLGDKAVILHSISAFAKSNLFDKLIISVPEDFIDYMNNLLVSENLSADVVSGGAERFETLEKVCRHIETSYGINSNDILISHDGVRPFVTKDIIEENISAVKNFGFSATAIKTTDTVIKRTDDSFTVPDRNLLYNLQTPQGFFIEEFFENYGKLGEDDKKTLTDASGIYLKCNKKIELVEGSPFNIKITTKADLICGEAFLIKGIQKKC